MPEFVRVVEFEVEGKIYNAEVILTSHSLEFYVGDDNKRLTSEQTYELFGSTEDNFNEVLDNFIEKVENLEADLVISWRALVNNK